ncbi:uncharacterized protein DSM5745_04717 [Aspergillus mulundensis]|uniref:MARVEL domain-containing protein n=1 Tax=Aspergillus mulundensis TaxID=1810919 RepID=A0A3D8S4N5_9EURO|nr:Uncharacterized protein DSM5745_04717 [Aspergillus mulundensis]RDW81160.1 Uncharacterized protein DSM5745_04717 [Aspergillus mulundensis]
MRRRSVKPSEYPALPFHFIRFILFISSLLVAIILAVFAYRLHQADQKFPWAFLVLIIAAFLSLLNLIVTTLLHCCHGLSPRLSLITNSIVFVIWAVAFVLFAWSVSHTILTTCNATYWATSTGITVCRIFKALFAFTIIGAAFLIASIALDVIAYRRQTRLGEYDPMALGVEGHNLAEYKPGAHNRDSSALSGSFPHPPMGAGPGLADEDRAPLVSGGRYDTPGHLRDRSEEMDIGDSRPLHQPPPYASNTALERYSDAPPQPHSRMRMSAYDNPYGYGQQTGYDPTAYR